MASTAVKSREKSTARLIISGSTADRSAYFARREAARVLRCVLQGDARGRAAASIKSLIYNPSIRNKKATFALVCQTLKYLPVLKNVLAAANVLSAKWKKQATLIYVTAYDVLFGQKIGMTGAAEKLLMLHKDALESALSKLCTRKAVKCIEELLLDNQNHVLPKPRYVRVNTLKINTETAIQELERIAKVKIDGVVPDMLVLPGGTDLHNHRLVLDGSIFLQGKASSMVAVALCPKPGWKVLDACAAPGNKTSHLAALMKGKDVEIIHCDFLDINASDRSFSKVRAILLDPSCSGSGTSAERLDHLLPSYSTDHEDEAAAYGPRVRKLAAFQKKALAHALSFPAVERVVYSTCSIHQAENEDVVKSVLPLATSLGFELGTPFPQWSLRGRPVFDGAERLLRTEPSQDTEGFFIALFVKKLSALPPAQKKLLLRQKKHFSPGGKWPFFPTKISKIWMRYCIARRRRGN
ncbi:hypothetical protein M5K25_024376 [Dendrobium thyrsiflorum]|uniref:SAM-dependent MTase RsmB/NOP-type domain-containing protein n=1 Tax=Dendrobium thyrsiflorum TaxID=117978 RepID=A0ABD0U1R9_DENTH